jgi:hypothetical protein
MQRVGRDRVDSQLIYFAVNAYASGLAFTTSTLIEGSETAIPQ